MVPNTYYFSSGLPRVKQLQYVLDSDDSLLVINLEKGITALTSDMSYGDVAGLQRQGVKVYVDPGAPTRTYMNVGPQFTDQNFRQAIAYAINRQQVVEDVYFGYAKPGQGQYSPNTYGYDPSITMFSASADVAMAKQLLAKANYPKSTLMITVPSAPRLNATAAILQANWQAIGLNVQVESLQIGAAVAKLVSGKFDFFLYEDFLGTGPGFTPNYIYTTLATKSPGNSADISGAGRRCSDQGGVHDSEQVRAASRAEVPSAMGHRERMVAWDMLSVLSGGARRAADRIFANAPRKCPA